MPPGMWLPASWHLSDDGLHPSDRATPCLPDKEMPCPRLARMAKVKVQTPGLRSSGRRPNPDRSGHWELNLDFAENRPDWLPSRPGSSSTDHRRADREARTSGRRPNCSSTSFLARSPSRVRYSGSSRQRRTKAVISFPSCTTTAAWRSSIAAMSRKFRVGAEFDRRVGGRSIMFCLPRGPILPIGDLGGTRPPARRRRPPAESAPTGRCLARVRSAARPPAGRAARPPSRNGPDGAARDQPCG